MSVVVSAPPPAEPEVVHLSPGAPLVPDAILEPPWRSDSRGTFRDLAALLLDRHLRRLARIRQPIDLRLARLLHRLETGSGYLALGFARLTDYATERLGLPSRRVQTLLTLARRLDDLPRLAGAFEAGHLSLSQVQLLLRVVTPDTEADWVARATTMTVRRLEAAVREAERGAAETGAAEAGATGTSATETRAAAAEDAPEPSSTASPPPRENLPAVDDDPAVAGEFISFSASARLRARWEQALELARRSSGATDPTWQSVEFIAAEYLSGVPDIAMTLSRSVAARVEDERAGATAAPSAAADAGDGVDRDGADRHGVDRVEVDGDGTDLYEEVLAVLAESARPGPGTGMGSEAPLPDDCPSVVFPDTVGDDP